MTKSMTVGDLVNTLNTYDPNMTIFVDNPPKMPDVNMKKYINYYDQKNMSLQNHYHFYHPETKITYINGIGIKTENLIGNNCIVIK